MAEIFRAHTFIASIGADTQKDLCAELREFALKIERGDISHGCFGGPSSGSLYSYKVRPEQTHEKYFEDIDAELRRIAEK